MMKTSTIANSCPRAGGDPAIYKLGPRLRGGTALLLRSLFAYLFVALLTSCTEGPPVTTPPDLTFSNLQPIQVNAASVDVIDNYKPPLQDPNIEHTFRLPPYVAAERLLRHQLVAAGSENTLRAIIDDASVIRTELPQDKGFMSYFEQQPTERLQAKMLIRFELVDPKAPDIVIAHAEIVARREKTLTEGMSPAERDQAYFDLTEDTMDEVNDGLKSIVRGTFGKKF